MSESQSSFVYFPLVCSGSFGCLMGCGWVAEELERCGCSEEEEESVGACSSLPYFFLGGSGVEELSMEWSSQYFM